MSNASEPTRIYLRDIRTGQFCQGPGRWTDCREEALAFQPGEEALRFVCEQNLRDVELFLVFADPDRYLRIPINPAC